MSVEYRFELRCPRCSGACTITTKRRELLPPWLCGECLADNNTFTALDIVRVEVTDVSNVIKLQRSKS
jgi:hypothetical protein